MIFPGKETKKIDFSGKKTKKKIDFSRERNKKNRFLSVLQLLYLNLFIVCVSLIGVTSLEVPLLFNWFNLNLLIDKLKTDGYVLIWLTSL